MIVPLLLAFSLQAAAASPADDALALVERELISGMAASVLANQPPVPDLARLKTALKLELRGSREVLCKRGACKRYPAEEDFQKLALELAPKMAEVAVAGGSPMSWGCAFEEKIDAILDGAPPQLAARMAVDPGVTDGAVVPAPGPDELYYFEYPPVAALEFWRDMPRPALVRRDEAAAHYVLQTVRAALIANNAAGEKPAVEQKVAEAAVRLFTRLRIARFAGRHFPGDDDFAHFGRSAARRIVGMAVKVRRGRWNCAADEKVRALLDDAVVRLAKAMPRGSGEAPPAAGDELAYYR